MKHIYGPVKSRRLGLSLGISLTPYKTCTFDCVYCQLGKTTLNTTERREYVPPQEILDEFKTWLQNNNLQAAGFSRVTLSGSGEPTLNLKIGYLISEIKKLTDLPVAVITNASLLADPSVRYELREADLIVPSLDAVTPGVFARIDVPHPGIKIEDVIGGLVSLRKEFRGKIWLEVMLVKGLNDDLRHIKKLKEAIDRINPDKIQLNSPVRATAEKNVLPVDNKKMEKIKKIIGDRCEIV